jgi:hypothetical protein
MSQAKQVLSQIRGLIEDASLGAEEVLEKIYQLSSEVHDDAELESLGIEPISDEQAKRMMEKILAPNPPLQIELGEGRVMVTGFTDTDGFGVMFRDSGSRHEIGALTGEPSGLHTAQPGEVYVKCRNRASALVLMEQVSWVVAQYHGAE